MDAIAIPPPAPSQAPHPQPNPSADQDASKSAFGPTLDAVINDKTKNQDTENDTKSEDSKEESKPSKITTPHLGLPPDPNPNGESDEEHTIDFTDTNHISSGFSFEQQQSNITSLGKFTQTVGQNAATTTNDSSQLLTTSIKDVIGQTDPKQVQISENANNTDKTNNGITIENKYDALNMTSGNTKNAYSALQNEPQLKAGPNNIAFVAPDKAEVNSQNTLPQNHIKQNFQLSGSTLSPQISSFSTDQVPIAKLHATQLNNPQIDFFNKETTFTPPAATISTEKIMMNLAQIPVEARATSLRDNVPTSLRHDIGNQFLETKIGVAEIATEQKNGQQFLEAEGKESKDNQSISLLKTGDSITETTFSHTLSQTSIDKANQPPIETTRPGMLPFTTPVNENDVLHQVMQKFRISQNLQDSKIGIKLHPAELGDLKVDIQLKDGTINASIQAQTQKAQEILEKNMPKLKTLMEQQGLKIGDIVVKLDADVTSEQNLFEEQLTQQDNMFSWRNSNTTRATFTLDPDFEELVQNEDENASGVNVKI